MKRRRPLPLSPGVSETPSHRSHEDISGLTSGRSVPDRART
nr:MAG: ORF3 [Torque teno polar bear virus 14]